MLLCLTLFVPELTLFFFAPSLDYWLIGWRPSSIVKRHRRMAELVAHTQWSSSLEEMTWPSTKVDEAGEVARSVFEDLPAELVEEASEAIMSVLDGSAAPDQADESVLYFAGEVRALLGQYASTRALLETGADPLIERGSRRRVGFGAIARLVDLDRALQRVPTKLFIALELNGLKNLSFREQTPFTAIPHTTAQNRFHRGIEWLVDYLNGQDSEESHTLRDPFWAVDLDVERLAGTELQFELWARRGSARSLIDKGREHAIRDRRVGEGWLLPPAVTDFRFPPQETEPILLPPGAHGLWQKLSGSRQGGEETQPEQGAIA